MTGPSTTPTPAAGTASASTSSSAAELVAAIESLLQSQQFLAARQVAARAAKAHSGHPWLELANRVLNPTRIAARPSSDNGIDRSKELDWLRSRSSEHRGKWVALLGDELIACADSFDEVLREVRSRDLADHPLVHRIAW